MTTEALVPAAAAPPIATGGGGEIVLPQVIVDAGPRRSCQPLPRPLSSWAGRRESRWRVCLRALRKGGDVLGRGRIQFQAASYLPLRSTVAGAFPWRRRLVVNGRGRGEKYVSSSADSADRRRTQTAVHKRLASGMLYAFVFRCSRFARGGKEGFLQ